jgi:tetratricopeptide (TPR) repeat protein
MAPTGVTVLKKGLWVMMKTSAVTSFHAFLTRRENFPKIFTVLVGCAILGFWFFSTLPQAQEPFKNQVIYTEFQQGWDNYRWGEIDDRNFPGLDRKGAIEYFAVSEKNFRAAIGKEPDRAELYFDLGNALFKEERYSDAVTAYLKAASLNPRDSDTQFNLNLARKMETTKK